MARDRALEEVEVHAETFHVWHKEPSLLCHLRVPGLLHGQFTVGLREVWVLGDVKQTCGVTDRSLDLTPSQPRRSYQGDFVVSYTHNNNNNNINNNNNKNKIIISCFVQRPFSFSPTGKLLMVYITYTYIYIYICILTYNQSLTSVHSQACHSRAFTHKHVIHSLVQEEGRGRGLEEASV